FGSGEAKFRSEFRILEPKRANLGRPRSAAAADALLTRTDAPQVAEGVDASRVAALEAEAQRVAADQGDIGQLQLVGRQLAHFVQAAGAALAPALSAGTGPAQHAARVGGAMAVLPLDDQDLGLAVADDRRRRGILGQRRGGTWSASGR